MFRQKKKRENSKQIDRDDVHDTNNEKQNKSYSEIAEEFRNPAIS
jgi:hypothetical protein